MLKKITSRQPAHNRRDFSADVSGFQTSNSDTRLAALERENRSLQSGVVRKRSNPIRPGIEARGGFLKVLLRSLRRIPSWILAWLSRKGTNGAIFSNGTMLAMIAGQLFMWLQAERISRGVARFTQLPSGARRPDGASRMGRIIGWLVENGGVLTLTNLRSLLPLPKPIPENTPANGSLRETFCEGALVILRNIVISTCSNLIAEQGAVGFALRVVTSCIWLIILTILHFPTQVILLHLASTRLYRKVPYFTGGLKPKRPANPMRISAYLDWLRGNAILQLVGGGFFLGVIESFMPRAAEKELEETEFSFPRFLRNFAIFRIVVDIVFCRSSFDNLSF